MLWKFLCIRRLGNCLERNVSDFWGKYAVESIENRGVGNKVWKKGGFFGV